MVIKEVLLYFLRPVNFWLLTFNRLVGNLNFGSSSAYLLVLGVIYITSSARMLIYTETYVVSAVLASACCGSSL